MPGLGGRIGATLHLPAQRGKRATVVVAVLVFAAAAGIGVGLGAPVLARQLSAAGAVPAIAPPPALVIPQPALRPAVVDGPVPTSSGVSAVLDPLVAAGGLGTLSGQVVDPATGTVLWQREPGTPVVPGSTAKLLTSAAALLALDHQARLHTTVLAGAEPGTVVLVGGGDPTLSAAGVGTETVYPGAARLDDLVSQVRAAARGPVVRVLVDVHRYTGDFLAPIDLRRRRCGRLLRILSCHSWSRRRSSMVMSSCSVRWTARSGTPCGRSTHPCSLALIHRTVQGPCP